jgi:glutamate-1-semialdehyde 2,1-aminomutase
MTAVAGDHDLVARAHAVIPGGSSVAAVLPAGREFIVERGEGAALFTTDGRRLTDYVLGGGPLVLGHAHPAIAGALRSAAADGTHHYVLHRRTVELAERICRHVESAESVRFTASGSEATLHALRLARAVTGRRGIVKFDGAYHGHHDLGVWSFEHSEPDGTRPVPESAGVQTGIAGDIVVLPFNDAAAIGALLDAQPDRFAAVICEPLQRALPPEPGFLEAVRAACDRSGAVLIFDEVVTGFRLAPGGAQERYGVPADLTTLGKALAGGMPLAALAGRRDLMAHLAPQSDAATRSFHCGTFNGYLAGVECAHATLDVLLDQGGIARLEEITQETAEALRRSFRDAGCSVHVTAAGGLFQPYFSERPVRNAADVRASDLARLQRFHELLLDAGVYKLPNKGYVGLAHGQEELVQLTEATAWALSELGSG